MIYIIYPNKDTTIYENDINLNTGIDEILSINSIKKDSNILSSRVLIQFPLETLQEYLTNNIISPTHQSELVLYTTEQSDLISDTVNFNIYPISGSWDMGLGRYHHRPKTTTGSSWTNRTTTKQWTTGSYNPLSTGSFEVYNGGGNWYTSSLSTCSFHFQTKDLRTNTTPITNEWLSGSIDNNGFIIKLEDEQVDYPLGSFDFYGRESNTIFSPRLLIKWDDSNYNKTGLNEVSGSNFIVYPKLRKIMKEGSKQRIDVFTRPRFIKHNFSTSSLYTTNNHCLPSSSYYQITDYITNVPIIPFDDEFTKISCDENGTYFNLWTDNFQPNRPLKVEFKVNTQDGQELYFDDKYTFVVRR